VFVCVMSVTARDGGVDLSQAQAAVLISYQYPLIVLIDFIILSPSLRLTSTPFAHLDLHQSLSSSRGFERTLCCGQLFHMWKMVLVLHCDIIGTVLWKRVAKSIKCDFILMNLEVRLTTLHLCSEVCIHS